MEKLTIEPDKIIHILLKHLMDLKNEVAYLKNKGALHSLEIDKEELKDGAKQADYSNKELTDGAKHAVGSIQELTDGAKHAVGSIQELTDGAKYAVGSIQELTDGAKYAVGSNKELTDGAKGADCSNKELTDGAKGADCSNKELREGAKHVLDALPISTIDQNAGALLYSVFEKELLKALEDYIKNGNGQNTVYSFYSDFMEAVEAHNLAATKSKDTTSTARLEDTHTLPSQITAAGTSFAILGDALQKNLPHAFNGDSYETLSHELLLLHNAGKATSAELRGFGGLSAAGFRKHLTKVVSLDLIKRQAPSNYVLTEKSIHILLQLFGIPKPPLGVE